MNTLKLFGQRLRQERLRLDLTQEAFAELGGVRRLAQHLYERGARTPDVQYVMHLGERGVDILFLLTGRQSNTAEAASMLSVRQATLAYDASKRAARVNSIAMCDEDERRMFVSLCETFASESSSEREDATGTAA